jgi:hypothetical protein
LVEAKIKLENKNLDLKCRKLDTKKRAVQTKTDKKSFQIYKLMKKSVQK